MTKTTQYFYDKDKDGAAYLIPESLKETWDRLSQLPNRGEYDGWIELQSHLIEMKNFSA